MKVTGALPGVTGGVSQLPPGDRQPGQCSEQVNFLSDRARGLARRPGSQWQGERDIGAQPVASHADATRWRTVPWRTANAEYTALMRTAAAEPGCTLPGLQVYSHDAKAFLPVVRGADADLDTLFSGGCSSATAVGAYLFLAGNDTVPRASSFDAVLDPAFATKSAVWVRGGAYGRTFTVKARVGSTWKQVTYTTPPAEYPGVLDTSSIPWSIPDPAGGTQAVSVTSLIASGNSGCRVHMGAWFTGGVIDVTVTNSSGTVLSHVGSGLVTSPLQWGGDPATSPIIMLHQSVQGEAFDVRYTLTYPPEYGPPHQVWETLTAVDSVVPRGVMYVGYHVTTPAVAGYTLAASPDGLGDSSFYYNAAFDKNYAYFAGSQIGKTVTLTGTGPKVITNPDYQRLADDAKLAYDRNVTAYLMASADAIRATAIARTLADRLIVAGVQAEVFDGHILIQADEVIANDGGSGELIRAVDTEVAAVEDLTDMHLVGKVVRIRPLGADSSYYVKATAKADGGTGFTEVVWVEAAGVVHTIEHALCYALVVGGTCYVASSAAKLAALTAGEHPEFRQSTAGDAVSSPLPAFIGKRITLLTTFQDRLVIGTGGTLCVSASSDYLRLMPSSVVTVPADSAFEVSAQGSDTDVLRQAVLYGRDMLIFGDQKQYAISGKTALTPTSVSLPVVSTVPGAAAVGPVAVGGLLLFASEGERGTAVSQMQPGLDPDNPSVSAASAHLSDYLAGAPQELARRGNPDTLYLRTRGAPRSVFQFRFEDTQRGREQASWSRWEFDPALGTVLGIAATKTGVLVFFLRDAGGSTYLVADLCSEDAAQSTRPYTDSQRTLAQVLAGGSVSVSSTGPWIAAYTSASTRYLIGDTLSKLPELRMLYGDTGLVIGCNQPTEYVMTNPYPRDRDGRPNRGARLTVTSIKVVAADSSGLVAKLTTPTGESSRTFLSRSVQDLGLIGRIPVGDWSQQVAVAKWNEGYTLTLSALRWYPLTITALDWTGQLFQRAQRI